MKNPSQLILKGQHQKIINKINYTRTTFQENLKKDLEKLNNKYAIGMGTSTGIYRNKRWKLPENNINEFIEKVAEILDRNLLFIQKNNTIIPKYINYSIGLYLENFDKKNFPFNKWEYNEEKKQIIIDQLTTDQLKLIIKVFRITKNSLKWAINLLRGH
tara:strand:+ start:19364 stop:19840 length:477 start_codon:yes stop_codon:yes gene_type:complete